MNCRHCNAPLTLPLVDLGSAPPSNAYLAGQDLQRPEKWYPLRVLVCERCWLAQTEDIAEAADLFDAEYAYFSGYSSTWLTHCEHYVEAMVARFGLDNACHVVEIAANDGSLLQYVRQRGIPCTGIEPTAATAAAARRRGIEVVETFFGTALARQLVGAGQQADLVTANNVLAHVPDINDFVAGVSILLEPQGVATFEFPHLLQLIQENQFDTIYHEHFSYLSLTAVERLFGANGLHVFDVEPLATHGGSLRIYAQRTDVGQHAQQASVVQLLRQEADQGMASPAFYRGFQSRVDAAKNDFLEWLVAARQAGRTVAAYGAAAKGNTLMNYAGVRPDLLAFVVDRNPAKQGKYMPGSRIPVYPEQRLHELQPDYVVILPWNLQQEVKTQLHYIRTWGGRFVTAIPELVIS